MRRSSDSREFQEPVRKNSTSRELFVTTAMSRYKASNSQKPLATTVSLKKLPAISSKRMPTSSMKVSA